MHIGLSWRKVTRLIIEGVIKMFYQPEVFVYLMLLPGACLIVLPALFSTTRVIIGIAKKSQPVKENLKVLEQEQRYNQEALAEA